jgi:hypothetical protein
MARKATDMHFVDDEIGAMPNRSVTGPVKTTSTRIDQPKRHSAFVRSTLRRSSAVERRREEHRLRIGVEERLVGIERMPGEGVISGGACHSVGVVASAANLRQRQATVPHWPRLVRQVVQLDLARHIWSISTV